MYNFNVESMIVVATLQNTPYTNFQAKITPYINLNVGSMIRDALMLFFESI